MSSDSQPLENLVEIFNNEFTNTGGNPDKQKIQKLLADYVGSSNQDWKEFAFYRDERYSRNLIHRNEHYELMLICWKKGQASSIHNHEGSSCWMACVEGQIEEQYFHIEEFQQPEYFPSSCPALRSGQVACYSKGECAFIEDEIALHRIVPHGDSNLVTIHMYSPPIETCLIYCPEVNKCSRVKLGYYTENKKVVNVPPPAPSCQ